ncbi:isoprenyl transferase [Dehalobacter sp. DCM]|uniref:isoprenyl transferase n=1 Tax=Dehalobacter sp. DCM TaxID=2907827 RepID=UPI003081C72F|nr:isoprenyl transferase [Dehalobacter sp. DCM]
MKVWKKATDDFSKKNIDITRIPKHLAIIMDGNGRWAQKKGLPRAIGHRAGVEALREIVRGSNDLGIKYLTIYAFSTENWKRPQTEVGILMSLLNEYIRKELAELHANNVKICILGHREDMPADLREACATASKKTSDNTGLVLNVALNYGGRSEILKAVKEIALEVKNGILDADQITEEVFESHLFTKGCPEPELVVRTSGEMRLSNFLLWQAAYSEIVIVDECWPDFNRESLLKTISNYQKRDRRFGGISEC